MDMAERRAVGDVCSLCDGIILSPALQGPTQCRDCKNLLHYPEETVHYLRVRCPHCEEITNPWTATNHHTPFQAGTAMAECPACHKPFTFEVAIIYQFYSPPINQGKPCPVA